MEGVFSEWRLQFPESMIAITYTKITEENRSTEEETAVNKAVVTFPFDF